VFNLSYDDNLNMKEMSLMAIMIKSKKVSKDVEESKVSENAIVNHMESLSNNLLTLFNPIIQARQAGDFNGASSPHVTDAGLRFLVGRFLQEVNDQLYKSRTFRRQDGSMADAPSVKEQWDASEYRLLKLEAKHNNNGEAVVCDPDYDGIMKWYPTNKARFDAYRNLVTALSDVFQKITGGETFQYTIPPQKPKEIEPVLSSEEKARRLEEYRMQRAA
jgi:hypothetical protein